MKDQEHAAAGREPRGGPIEDEQGGEPAQNVEPADGERPADDGEITAGDEAPADEPAAPKMTDGVQESRKPISSRAKVLVVAMSALLGFGIVIQVRQTQDDEFSSLRQDDLVRLLDEVTQRNEDLATERDQLLRDRASLRSGSDSQRLAQEYQLVHGVLAGTEPVEGPGVVVTVQDGDEVSAQTMVHMLEELRNAGAEAVEVSGQRLVASSAFVDTEDGVLADNQLLTDPIEWRAIGNAQTMAVALDIPGGALAGFRNAGATVEVEQRNLVQITAIREAAEPEFAEPAEPED